MEGAREADVFSAPPVVAAGGEVQPGAGEQGMSTPPREPCAPCTGPETPSPGHGLPACPPPPSQSPRPQGPPLRAAPPFHPQGAAAQRDPVTGRRSPAWGPSSTTPPAPSPRCCPVWRPRPRLRRRSQSTRAAWTPRSAPSTGGAWRSGTLHHGACARAGGAAGARAQRPERGLRATTAARAAMWGGRRLAAPVVTASEAGAAAEAA